MQMQSGILEVLLDKGTFPYYVSKRGREGVMNAYARVKNQEIHSIMHAYRGGGGGLKKSRKMPYVISERSLGLDDFVSLECRIGEC